MYATARFVTLAAVCLSTAPAALAALPYPNTSNFGVPFSKDEAWYQQCIRVEKLKTPPMPAVSEPCDASGVYYTKRGQAATSQAEWNKVRACAITRADNSVLMMLYANGFGVPRNTDMAIHYACGLEFIAKSEMEHRIEHLAAAARNDVAFDQCDDITSGYMGSVCAAIKESQDERTRVARLDRAISALPPASRSAFAKLRIAAERYANEAMGEVDMQGTAAPALSMAHGGRLREEFMQAALDSASGKLPAASAEEFAQRDAELNALYKDVMGAPTARADWPDNIGESTISHAAIRKTERLWLAYRDAFVAYVATLPSGPDAVAVKALLTGQRIAGLAKVARYRSPT
ncbi:MAG: DUF1311 domain-containing protein [Pseudomonadota bacterium]|nr:DUF1311 domain-containing protein [Pseudomonadota bacterium]